MPKVSVIITTYNRDHTVANAINSILGQNFPDLELLVVDDASTDRTENIVRGFTGRGVVYIRSEVNRGEGASRNLGVARSSGKYVAFLDSDDEAMPGRIVKQVEVLDREPGGTGVVYSDMLQVDEKGRKKIFRSPHIMPVRRSGDADIIGFGFVSAGIGSSMLRRECFDKVSGFDERLAYYVDLDFFIRLSRSYEFYHLTEPLTKYYVLSRVDDAGFKKRAWASRAILEKYYDDLKKDKKALSAAYGMVARDSMLAGETGGGRKFFLKAFLLDPWSPKKCFMFLLSLLGGSIFSFLLLLARRVRQYG